MWRGARRSLPHALRRPPSPNRDISAGAAQARSVRHARIAAAPCSLHWGLGHCAMAGDLPRHARRTPRGRVPERTVSEGASCHKTRCAARVAAHLGTPKERVAPWSWRPWQSSRPARRRCARTSGKRATRVHFARHPRATGTSRRHVRFGVPTESKILLPDSNPTPWRAPWTPSRADALLGWPRSGVMTHRQRHRPDTQTLRCVPANANGVSDVIR